MLRGVAGVVGAVAREAAGKELRKGMSSKKQRRAEARRGRSARSSRRWWILGAVIVAGAVVGGWTAWQQATRPGQSVASMGRAHVPGGTPPPQYNTRPPTSGPHAGAVPWREYREPVPEINQVHNLEHGGILIQYNCERLDGETSCPELVGQLRRIYERARDEVDPKIVLAPYRDMEHPVAVTAWRRLKTFDGADEAGILAFADANVNRAPEQVQ